MSNNKITAIEQLLKSNNDWYDKHVFSVYCKMIDKEYYKDAGKALSVYVKFLSAFLNNLEQPITAMEEAEKIVKAEKYNNSQMLLMYEKANSYISSSEFDYNTKDLTSLLEIHTNKLLEQYFEENPSTPDREFIGTTIRKYVFKELEKLPETLDQLEPKERINALSKLLPYVVSKYAMKDEEGTSSFRFL